MTVLDRRLVGIAPRCLNWQCLENWVKCQNFVVAQVSITLGNIYNNHFCPIAYFNWLRFN